MERTIREIQIALDKERQVLARLKKKRNETFQQSPQADSLPDFDLAIAAATQKISDLESKLLPQSMESKLRMASDRPVVQTQAQSYAIAANPVIMAPPPKPPVIIQAQSSSALVRRVEEHVNADLQKRIEEQVNSAFAKRAAEDDGRDASIDPELTIKIARKLESAMAKQKPVANPEDAIKLREDVEAAISKKIQGELNIAVARKIEEEVALALMKRQEDEEAKMGQVQPLPLSDVTLTKKIMDRVNSALGHRIEQQQIGSPAEITQRIEQRVNSAIAKKAQELNQNVQAPPVVSRENLDLTKRIEQRINSALAKRPEPAVSSSNHGLPTDFDLTKRIEARVNSAVAQKVMEWQPALPDQSNRPSVAAEYVVPATAAAFKAASLPFVPEPEKKEDRELKEIQSNHARAMAILQAEKEKLLLVKEIETLKKELNPIFPPSVESSLILDYVLLAPRDDFADSQIRLAYGIVTMPDDRTINMKMIPCQDVVVARDRIVLKYNEVIPVQVNGKSATRLFIELRIYNGDKADLAWTYFDIVRVNMLIPQYGQWKPAFYLPPTPVSLDVIDQSVLKYQSKSFCALRLLYQEEKVTFIEDYNEIVSDSALLRKSVEKLPQPRSNNSNFNMPFMPPNQQDYQMNQYQQGQNMYQPMQNMYQNQQMQNMNQNQPMQNMNQNSPQQIQPAQMKPAASWGSMATINKIEQMKKDLTAAPSNLPQVALPQKIAPMMVPQGQRTVIPPERTYFSQIQKSKMGQKQDELDNLECSVRVSMQQIVNLAFPFDFIRPTIIYKSSKKKLPDLPAFLHPKTMALLSFVNINFKMMKIAGVVLQLEFINEHDYCIAWTAVPLYDGQNLLEGQKIIDLFRGPIDATNQEVDNANIVFEIRSLFSASDIENILASAVPNALSPINNLWINTPRKPIEADPALSGTTSFRLCIDGIRFLPLNILFCRVHAQIYDKNLELIPNTPNVLSKFTLESDAMAPKFYGATDVIEMPLIDASSIIFIKIYGLQEGTEDGELVLVGFTVVDVFVDPNTGEQPETTEAATNAFLNYGNFQLPIYPGKLEPMKNLSSSSVPRKYPMLSCSTLLVRILPATEESKAPSYEKGQFDSSLCVPTPKECEIYRYLASVTDRRPYRDSLVQLGIFETADEADIKGLNWISSRFDATKVFATEFPAMNSALLCPYSPVYGLSIAVRGAQNLSHKKLSCAILSICPPGSMYDKEIGRCEASTTKFTFNLNFESSVKSPEFVDEFWNVFPEPSLTSWAIIALSTFDPLAKPKKKSLENHAWAAFPLFISEQHSYHGTFQLPLFEGKPKKSIIYQFQIRDRRTVFKSMIKEGIISLLKGESIFLSISDARRDAELALFNRETADTRFLPQDEKKRKKYFDIISTEKVGKLIPDKIGPLKFSEFMENKVKEELKMVPPATEPAAKS